MKYRSFLLLLTFYWLAGNDSRAAIRLPALFSDHLVLQQRSAVAIWGWADPGELVTVTGSWNGKSQKVKADAAGKWQLTLQTGKAGGPYHLTCQGSNTVRLDNILLGEVWLCSGQSNMNFPLGRVNQPGNWRTGVPDYEKEIAAANYPRIRMFTVAQKVSRQPEKDVAGKWEVCSPATAENFSAVAYYFAREVSARTGVPVGIIHSSWGGTPAEAWTRHEVLADEPDFQPILDRFDQALANYERAKAQAAANPEAGIKKPANPVNNQMPSGLYNAMIAPLVPYTVKGMLWYQGESNAQRAYQYRKLFPALIQSWRQDWQSQLPFYFVQIAPHRSQNPEIREAQLLTYRTVPQTGMVVITDHGDSLDIHPRNKKVVGERLALWALAKTYGRKNIVYSGPLYQAMQVEQNQIRLRFTETGGGLVAPDGGLREFTIAGADQQFYPAQARIEGQTVVVWSEQVPQPVAVRFNWRFIPTPGLYNRAGLPASPFRTDDWPGITQGKN